MVEHQSLIGRRVLSVALDRMRDEPVVLLEGPRSVGKSTLLQAIAGRTNGHILDLDDVATMEAVATDPATMVEGQGPVCVDEYQRAPIVLDAIKAELNSSSRPGQFVLTGSARHQSLPTAAQALTGRLHRMAVLPFAQSEIEGVNTSLLSRIFDGGGADTIGGRPSPTTRVDYIERIVRGGFPLALNRTSTTARHRWFDDCVRLTLEHDVRDLSRVRQAHALPSVLARMAGQTAVAQKANLELNTARDYTRLLEAVFLIQLLPAWGKTLTSRSSSAPKVHVLDSGVGARLLRLTPDKLSHRDPTSLTELGHLMETFVVGELLKEASWMDGIVGVGHWRTYDGDEVDLVVERDDGAVVAFEIKAAGACRAANSGGCGSCATHSARHSSLASPSTPASAGTPSSRTACMPCRSTGSGRRHSPGRLRWVHRTPVQSARCHDP